MIPTNSLNSTTSTTIIRMINTAAEDPRTMSTITATHSAAITITITTITITITCAITAAIIQNH